MALISKGVWEPTVLELEVSIYPAGETQSVITSGFLEIIYFYWSIVDLQCLLVSGAQQSDSLIHIFIF